MAVLTQVETLWLLVNFFNQAPDVFGGQTGLNTPATESDLRVGVDGLLVATVGPILGASLCLRKRGKRRWCWITRRACWRQASSTPQNPHLILTQSSPNPHLSVTSASPQPHLILSQASSITTSARVSRCLKACCWTRMATTRPRWNPGLSPPPSTPRAIAAQRYLLRGRPMP